MGLYRKAGPGEVATSPVVVVDKPRVVVDKPTVVVDTPKKPRSADRHKGSRTECMREAKRKQRAAKETK